MEDTYKDIHEFRKEDLEDLFLSVEWSSGHYPDKLVVALRIALIAYDKELAFYESCGFKKADDASPMFITSLWT